MRFHTHLGRLLFHSVIFGMSRDCCLQSDSDGYCPAHHGWRGCWGVKGFGCQTLWGNNKSYIYIQSSERGKWQRQCFWNHRISYSWHDIHSRVYFSLQTNQRDHYRQEEVSALKMLYAKKKIKQHILTHHHRRKDTFSDARLHKFCGKFQRDVCIERERVRENNWMGKLQKTSETNYFFSLYFWVDANYYLTSDIPNDNKFICFCTFKYCF